MSRGAEAIKQGLQLGAQAFHEGPHSDTKMELWNPAPYSAGATQVSALCLGAIMPWVKIKLINTLKVLGSVPRLAIIIMGELDQNNHRKEIIEKLSPSNKEELVQLKRYSR